MIVTNSSRVHVYSELLCNKLCVTLKTRLSDKQLTVTTYTDEDELPVVVYLVIYLVRLWIGLDWPSGPADH